MNISKYLLLSMITLFGGLLSAQTKLSDAEKNILQSIEDAADQYTTVAQQIWEWAELGYQEEKSSALLQETLQAEGFKIETGVAEIPTAFVATYGQGQPVIAVLAMGIVPTLVHRFLICRPNFAFMGTQLTQRQLLIGGALPWMV